MFHDIPIDVYKGYYKPSSEYKIKLTRYGKLFERFKEINNTEPTITDKNGIVYFHPNIFHVIAEACDLDYTLKVCEMMAKKSPEKSLEKKPTKEITTSYNLGKIGEASVLETIQQAKPMYESVKVSATGHVGDIHVTDKVNMIKYLVEVKDKGVITKEDITKFENDINQLQETNGLMYKHIYGIFISLESDIIPSIGKYKITSKQIYLSKSMYSKDTLSIIFSMFETMSILSETTSNRLSYDVPIKVYELISRLRIEYNTIVNEEELYKNMITNCENNLVSISTLQRNNLIKKEFIRFINNEFANILPVVDDGINVREEKRLRDYLKSHKKKEILKKTLINEFPSYITEMSSMKLTDFINKYSK